MLLIRPRLFLFVPRGILNNLPIDFPCYVANVWEPHLVCNAIPVHIFVRPRPESYHVFLPKDPKDGIDLVNNKSYTLFAQGDSDFSGADEIKHVPVLFLCSLPEGPLQSTEAHKSRWLLYWLCVCRGLRKRASDAPAYTKPT